MGGTNLDNEGPKNISRTYKRKLLGAGTFIELELLRIVFSDLYVFSRLSNPKKAFYRGPVCLPVTLNEGFLGNETK